jgi:hypothetical protein
MILLGGKMVGNEKLDQELEPVHSRINTQIEEIVDAKTDWIELAKNLDVERFKRRDGHPDWHSGTPFRPMFLAYLWSEVEDEALGTLRTRLENDHDLAAAFGFNPDDLPSESTFRPCRVEDRFEMLQSTVEDAATTIRDVSARCGAPIGLVSAPPVSQTKTMGQYLSDKKSG